jgi:membrane peptidoglycan carboxypeptidase
VAGRGSTPDGRDGDERSPFPARPRLNRSVGSAGADRPGRSPQPSPRRSPPAPAATATRGGGRDTYGDPYPEQYADPYGQAPAPSSTTGSFPAAYARVPTQDPTGYEPGPGGRGRRTPPPRSRRLIDYPRWGRDGWTRWIPSWKLVSAFIGTGIIAMIIALGVAYASTDLPPEDAQTTAQTSTIYFKDGKTPIGTLAAQNRQNVELAQVPTHVRDAVLAAEDHTFYTNSGVDPRSIVRAAWSNLRGNAQQGGSTISQQYVKNVYDQKEASYKRKAKEVFRAIKVNRQVSKDDILKRYLNTIYLGDGSYGIQAASQSYFGKDVEKLDVSEGAFLAGIINAPSLSDPRDGKEQKARALRRWNVVLDALVTEGKLDPTERASMKFPKFVKHTVTVTKNSQNGFLMDMAKAEVKADLNIDDKQLLSGGYKIVTTFDPRAVKAAAAAVKRQIPKSAPKRLQLGVASIDPSSGAIRAVYGGKEYKGPSLSNATLQGAQAGSTFKAFGLIAALEEGYSLKDQYNAPPTIVIDGNKVRNDEPTNHGYMDLIRATANSVNTVYVQLNKDIGPARTKDAAATAGIDVKKYGMKNNLVNVLGSANPTPLNLAEGYATIASGGVHHEPYSVQKITKIDSKKLLWNMDENKTKGKRVFKADVIKDATYALQAVVKTGTGTCAQALGRPVAGKTGTSTKSRSVWFAAFTPQLATTVGMWQLPKTAGHDNVPMNGFGRHAEIFGGGYPCEIWTDYMTQALKGKEVIDFPAPVYGGDVSHKAPVQVAPTEKAPQTQQPDQPNQPNQPTVAPTVAPTIRPTQPDTDPTTPNSNPTTTSSSGGGGGGGTGGGGGGGPKGPGGGGGGGQGGNG